MADGELAQKFVDDVIQVGARGERIQILFVLLFAVGRIHAVQVGIVEVAALDAPHLVIHLLPFGDGIDVHFHIGHVQRAFAGLHRGVGGNDRVLRAPRDHPRRHARRARLPRRRCEAASSRHSPTDRTTGRYRRASPFSRVLRSNFESVLPPPNPPRPPAAPASRMINRAGFPGHQIAIIARRQRQRDDPLR